MKILYITGAGEDDFGAMSVEQEIGVKEAYQLAKENGGSYTYETDETYADISIKEFGDVDPKFITFIRNEFIDYDNSKATDFHVIEEDEK